MNEKEIAEIRRRLRPEYNNIGRIRGCFVNENHTIISEFDQNPSLISSDESEEILSLLRRTLSGGLGRNLIDISFTTQQVSSSDEHALLNTLRTSSLSDEESVKIFFQKAIESIDIEGSYFLFLANDKYDVFSKDENGEKADSNEVFSYIICAVCPIKSTKPALGYSLSEKRFKNILRDSIISSPNMGFMFPAFDDRKSNIYGALFYTRDVSVSHEDFINTIFKTKVPKPASHQAESIANILNSTVSDDCDIELIQALQGQLIEIAEDHKSNKEEEPLRLSSKDIGTLLRCSGVSEESIQSFSEKFEDDFGEFDEIPPSNVMDMKKFEVKTPEVTIKVDPAHSELIQTRIINGTKYLLIRADSEVVVNGIKVNISE